MMTASLQEAPVARIIDPTERLQEGWEPSPGPVMGPGGQIIMPPTRRLRVVGPPALCKQGPCVHYHEATVVIDSAEARDGSDTVDHVQTIKTCYPHDGIEFDLNGAPVTECNMWEGLDPEVIAKRRVRMEALLLSEEGQKYLRELSDWRAHNAQLEEDAIASAEASRLEEEATQAAIDANNEATQDPQE